MSEEVKEVAKDGSLDTLWKRVRILEKKVDALLDGARIHWGDHPSIRNAGRVVIGTLVLAVLAGSVLFAVRILATQSPISTDFENWDTKAAIRANGDYTTDAGIQALGTVSGATFKVGAGGVTFASGAPISGGTFSNAVVKNSTLQTCTLTNSTFVGTATGLKGANALVTPTATVTKQTGAVTATSAITKQTGAVTASGANALVTPTATVTKQTGAVTASGANALVTPTATMTLTMVTNTWVYLDAGSNVVTNSIVYVSNATCAITPDLASNAVVAVTVTGGEAVVTNLTVAVTPDLASNAVVAVTVTGGEAVMTNATAAVTVTGGDAVVTNLTVAVTPNVASNAVVNITGP